MHKNHNPKPPHLLSHPHHEVEVCRGREVSGAKVTMVPFFDNRADYLKGTCTRKSCEYWHPPECQLFQNETGCKAGDKCQFPHHKVDNNQIKSRRQERCGHCENCTTIGMRLARLGNIGFSKRKTVPGKPDAKSLRTDSKNTTHPVYATSSKYPGKERTIAWSNTSQTSSLAKSPRYEI